MKNFNLEIFGMRLEGKSLIIILFAVIISIGGNGQASAAQDENLPPLNQADQVGSEKGYNWAAGAYYKLKQLHDQGNMIQVAVQKQKKRIFRLQGLLIISALLNLIILGVLLWKGGGGAVPSFAGGAGETSRANSKKPASSGAYSLRKIIITQAIALSFLAVVVLLFMFGF